ncbi:MAG: 4-(cytidine 5'-diphospho)-2-C-methyl-D-erythritol kinase [Caldimonas sp.]
MAIAALYDVPAPAKLNLTLRIVGRRSDGYHLLDSRMVLIDWADSLQFERRGDGRISRHDSGAALPADDLCLRAARALKHAAATPLGADITIAKRVPWGAGLGGGSSDAASTLLALNRLWGLNWPLETLLPIGLALGADVPFFLAGENARACGIGEQLSALAQEPGWYAVVKPAASLPTRAVFAHPEVAARVEAARIAGFSESVAGNDLQAAAEDLCPDVKRVAALLFETYGNSRMTGSGSAVFASAGKGPVPTAVMPEHWPDGWTGRMCRSLERHPLAGWAGSGQV